MTRPRFIFEGIAFNSQIQPPATVDLRDGLNIIYGASNTGKTFFLKSLDFMLGASGDLPEIDERNPFDRIVLNVAVDGDEKFVLRRALVGGSFELSSPQSAPMLENCRRATRQKTTTTCLIFCSA